jgi:hypothetical protein
MLSTNTTNVIPESIAVALIRRGVRVELGRDQPGVGDRREAAAPALTERASTLAA